MTPLLSIVIPTKDRQKYLIPLLKTLNTFKRNDFEVIIQDNSTNNDEIVEYLNSINDYRFKYHYIKRNLSIIENSNHAVLNSSGKFITFIGDDDGIIPLLLDYIDYIDANNIDALLPKCADYRWPDIKHKYKQLNQNGVVTYYKLNKKATLICPKRELMKSIRSGGFSLFNMPRLYHGVVSKEILEIVYKINGTYFPGPSPDMSSSVSIALNINRCLYVKLPLIISGKGYNSSTGQGLRKLNVKKITDVPWLPEDTLISWDKNIPKIWTGQTIWGESLIRSLDSNGRKDLVEKFNYSALYGNLLAKNPHLYKLIIPYIKLKNILSILFNFLFIVCKRIYCLYSNHIKSKIFKNTIYKKDRLHSINECINYLDSLCINNNFRDV